MTRSPHPARVILLASGRTQTDFARAKGYAPHYVYSVMGGHQPFTPAFRRALAEFLGCPEEELFPLEAQKAETEAVVAASV